MAGKVLVIGGTSSNVGKTSLALGIMVALRRMGLSVQPFKIGPAFTDPMQHHLVSGSPYINLDSWLMGREALLRSVHELSAGCDIALVEGAMGLFDGLDNRSEDGSTAQVAKWLGAPVLLVLDTWSVGRSAAAIIKGYQQFDQSVDLAGVLFNRITDSEQLRVLKDALDGADVCLPVLGGVPKDDLMPQEAMLQDAPAAAGALLEHIAQLVEQHVDLQRLLACAKPLQPAQQQLQPAAPLSQPRTRIAVAQDPAFCFYYRENLALLQQSGAELVPFSPLQEQQLPASISGIYLGGGYPELYSQQLAANICMLASVRAFAAAGGVIFAECGGLMYLGQSIEQQHGSVERMAGVFSYRTRMTSGPLRSGYLEVDVLHGCPLFPAGAQARGYMSHLCEVVQEVCQSLGAEPAASEGSTAGISSSERRSYSARVVHATKAGLQAKDAVAEGYTAGRALASLVHLHFSSCPQLAQALVEACCQVDAAAAAAAATEAVTAACTQQLLAARPRRSIASVKSLPDLQAAATAALSQHSRLPRVLSQGTLSPERSTYKQEGAARMRHTKSLSMESGLEVAPEVAHRLHAKLHGPAILAATAGAAGPVAAAGERGSPTRLANWAAGIPGSIEAVASRVQHMLQQKGVPAEAASAAAAAAAAAAGTGCDHTEQLLNSHLPVLGRSHAKGIGLAVPISRSSSSSNICVSGAAAAVMMQQLVPLGGKPPMAPLSHPSPLHMPSCDKEPAVLSAPLEHKLASSQRASFSSQSSPELWILGRPSAQFSHGSTTTTDSLGELSGGKLSKLSSTYSDHPHQAYHSHQQHPFNALAAGITPAEEGYSSGGLPAVPALPAVKAGRSSMQQESPRKLRPSLQQQQPLTPQQQQQQQQRRQQAFHLPSALASASHAAAAGRRRRPVPLALHHIHNDTIVSLCPAATDTVLAMGLFSRLVARTDMCDLPLDLADTPLVANLKLDPSRLSAADTVAKAQELAASGETLHKLDEGWLREEQPGVVLVPASGSPYDVDGASVLQALERAGLLRPDATTTIVCHECYSMADVLQFALLVGQAAGVPEAADMVVERLRARLRRLRGLTLQAPKQPRVLVLESVHPLVAAGHWAAEVQALAGAAACFPQQAQDRPRALSWEEVRRMAPEVLVISQHLQRAERAVLEVAELAAQPGWWSLPAVRSGQVYVVDCSLVSRPGPRLVDGAEVLGSLLHPQLVPRKAGLHGLVLKLSLSAGQRCRHCLVPNYFVAW